MASEQNLVSFAESHQTESSFNKIEPSCTKEIPALANANNNMY